MALELDLKAMRAQVVADLSEGVSVVNGTPATFWEDLLQLADAISEASALKAAYSAKIALAADRQCFHAMAQWLVPLVLQEKRRRRRAARPCWLVG